MSIRGRLAVSYAVLLMFIVAILSISAVRFSELSEQIRMVIEQDAERARLAGTINLQAESVAGRLLLLFIVEEREQRVVLYRDLDARNQAIDDAMAQLQGLAHSDEERQMLARLAQLRADYQARLQETVEALELGSVAKARAMMAGDTRAALERLLALTSDMEATQQASMVQRQARVVAITENSTLIVLALGAAALLAGLVMSVLIMRSITRPLALAVSATERIAAGDLGCAIVNDRDDEIGHLLNSMSNMRQRLHAVIGEIRQGATQVSSAAGQMRQMAEGVRSDTEGQCRNASDIDSGVVSLSTAAASMADDVQVSRDHALNARNLAGRGLQAISEAAQEITSIAQAVAESASSVTRLTESVAQIAGAVGHIREIADQTNLLALNASIEAARAGESGRGFAVVAEEVRNLARRAADVTSQIDRIITSIDEQTTQTAQRIDAGKAGMDRGVVLIRDLVLPLRSLDDGARQSLESLERLTSLAQAQADGSGGISQQMGQIVERASASQEATRQLSGLTDELLAIARRTESSVGVFQLK